MGRVTSKLQVTVPKVIATRFSIKPGDEIDWIPAGDTIRVVTRVPPAGQGANTLATRLRQFDQATARLHKRKSKLPAGAPAPANRGWTREDLYRRGRAG